MRGEGELTIERVGEPQGDAGMPHLRWIEEDDGQWFAGPPAFVLGNPDDAFAAFGWVALTQEALLLHVEVKDEASIYPLRGAAMADGDSLKLVIDPWSPEES